jgi:hypothetical protein
MNLTDPNDYLYAIQRLPKGVSIISENPAPYRKGRPHFNFSEFNLSNGEKFWISHVKPVYYINQRQEVRPLSEVLSHHGNRFMTLKPGWEKMVDFEYLVWLTKRQALLNGALFMPMSRVPVLVNAFGGPYFPDPSVEVTTVDGIAADTTTNEAWSAKQPDIGNGSDDASASIQSARITASAVEGTPWSNIYRGIFLFDTAAIPDTDTISAATFSLYNTAKSDALSQSISICSSAPATNTAVVSGDYDSLGTTKFATDITITSITTNAYTGWALNAAGITNISKTGVSKFGNRCSGDIDNVEPTWSSAADAAITTNFADTADTTTDPKLTGTSAVVATSKKGLNLSMLGVG